MGTPYRKVFFQLPHRVSVFLNRNGRKESGLSEFGVEIVHLPEGMSNIGCNNGYVFFNKIRWTSR